MALPYSFRRVVVLAGMLTFAVILASCASARKRFEQGAELEREGLYVEAANRYIQSLERDREQIVAREGLQRVAPDAVDMLLSEVAAHEAANMPIEAADAYLHLDDLAHRASLVGVDFMLPGEYGARRDEAMHAAVKSLFAAGRAAEEAGDWHEALALYDRIAAYEPASDEADEAEASAIRVLLSWARTDLDRGTYTSAVARADEVVERLGGPGALGAEVAIEIRRRAIEAGTVFVAFTPIWEDDGSRQGVPTDFLAELNDFLEIAFWSRPPLMVASTDPIVLRRELRRLRYNRSTISPVEAARVGRRVQADIVFVGSVTRLAVEEADVRERRLTARTREGETVRYTQRSGTLRYEAEVEIALVDIRSRRIVDRGRIRERESGRFEHAVYEGDYRDLELSRSERRAFDEDRWRDQELAIEEELIEALAEEIAEEAFDDIVRRLP